MKKSDFLVTQEGSDFGLLVIRQTPANDCGSDIGRSTQEYRKRAEEKLKALERLK